MIKQFPVADSLHLLHLGLMKRLLTGWIEGNFRRSDTKWPARTTLEVSHYLETCKLPFEFQRYNIRSLEHYRRWKGTEFRNFLHYVGIVALKDYLTEDAYIHFLLLFVAITICSSKELFDKLPIANAMLIQFIEIFGEIYGEHHITSNVHNLCHIVDDVKQFGELDSFSSYPFESALGQIKLLVRHGKFPLAQIAKRLMEQFEWLDIGCGAESTTKPKPTVFNPILSKKRKCPLEDEAVDENYRSEDAEMRNNFCYAKIQLESFCLCTDDRVNCWFLSKENEIVCVTSILWNLDIIGYILPNKTDFFELPLISSNFGIYSVSANSTDTVYQKFTVDDIKCKLVLLHYHNTMVFIPLRHT